MLPRGLLMLSPRPMLMPTTLDMVDTDTVLAMLDMAMPLPTPTMERGLLMLSLRLMLTPLCSMEPMAHMAMEPTPMPMATMERGLLMPSPRLMLLFSMELMVVFMVDTAMLLPMPMVPMPTPMVDTTTASKKYQPSV